MFYITNKEMICANLKCENIFATKWTYSHLWDLFLDLPNNHWHNITPWQDCIESVCVCGGGGGGGENIKKNKILMVPHVFNSIF